MKCARIWNQRINIDQRIQEKDYKFCGYYQMMKEMEDTKNEMYYYDI